MTPFKYSTCRSRLNRKFPAWLAAVAPGAGRNVGFLVRQRHAAGDAVVFDPRVPSNTVVVKVGADVVVFQIVADVPIKFAVIEVAGVPLLGRPHLVGRFHVPAEESHPAGGIDGREHTVPRARFGEQHPVGIQKRETDAVLFQKSVHARGVGAFGKPDPLGGPAEVALVILNRNADLGPSGFFVDHERQIAVGRATGNDLEQTEILQGFKPF
jgi:hypothetical protein